MLPTRSRSENAMSAVPMSNVPTSLFDLSHFHRTSFAMGDLVPFYQEFCLPGDRWQLRVEAQLRTPSLYFPVMEKLEIHTAFFFVRYSALYDGWKAVVKPNFDDQISEEQIPYVQFTYQDSVGAADTTNWMKTIISYFGIPVPTVNPATDVTLKVNALPFAAYWKIWNDFYRDTIVQPEWGFPEGFFVRQTEEPLIRNLDLGDPNWTSDYLNYWDEWWLEMNGAIDPGGFVHREWMPTQRNWNPDYFTAGTYSPQYGEKVQIPVFDQDLIGGPMNPSIGYGAATGTLPTGTNGLQVTPSGIENTNSALISIDVSGTAGTLAQLRYAEALQTFLERVNRAGDRYRNHVREFYGADPGDSGDYAVYIGSQTSVIPIGEVWQTTPGTNDTEAGQELGAYAGRAIGQQFTNTFNYSCPDFGHLIGIINVQNRSSYHQGLSKYWTMETWEDIPQAQFAHIGDEEVLERELLLRMDLGFDNENQLRTFSYVPRYSWMRYRNDYISGELRKFYTQFHMSRSWPETGTTPQFNGRFLQAHDIPVDQAIRVNADYHSVYAWIWTQAQVIRALPKYGVPML